MDVGRDLTRLVKCADADKADDVACAAVIAPQRNLAVGAAPDLLPASAFGRSHDRLGRSAQRFDLVAFDQRIDNECRSRLCLAAGAIATVDEHWITVEPVPDGPTGAASFAAHAVTCLSAAILASTFKASCADIAAPSCQVP